MGLEQSKDGFYNYSEAIVVIFGDQGHQVQVCMN